MKSHVAVRRALCLAIAASAFLAADVSFANCCDVVKVDPEIPISTLRVCSPDASGDCGSVLFEGPISLGQSVNVCVDGDMIVYQEWDATSLHFGALVTAVCEGFAVDF